MNTTLKRKLTLVLVSILLLLGVAFFAVSAFITQVTLRRQIDHHIHVVVLESQRIIQTYSGEDRLEILKNLVSSQGMTIILLNADASPILQTNSPDIASISEHQLQQIVVSSSDRTTPQHFTIGAIRFATVPVQLESGQGVLAVGYSTQIVTTTLRTLVMALGAILMVIMVLAVLILYGSLSTLLSPLEKIAKTALSISSSDRLSTRISPLPHTSELRSIALALNSMLSRIQKVFENEHAFFADAAHTLKTPLAVLRSQIETSSIPAHQKQPMLATIDTSTDSIRELLFISEIQTQQFSTKAVSLSTLLQDLSELAATLSDQTDITIKQHIEPDITIEANPSLLSRALGNIVKNAVDHTPNNGTITIRLSIKNNHPTIRISNTGSTITAADRKHIFDRFYQGKNATHSGSGLGLAITKAILDRLNATIRVASRNNTTTFTIDLPSSSLHL